MGRERGAGRAVPAPVKVPAACVIGGGGGSRSDNTHNNNKTLPDASPPCNHQQRGLSTRGPPLVAATAAPAVEPPSHAAAPTVVRIALAQTGEGIKECELTRWFVEVWREREPITGTHTGVCVCACGWGEGERVGERAESVTVFFFFFSFRNAAEVPMPECLSVPTDRRSLSGADARPRETYAHA